jgi:hypothetical protein
MYHVMNRGGRREPIFEDDLTWAGVVIRFSDTGEVAAYSFQRAVSNPDLQDEVMKWEYLPTPESVQDVPRCRKTKVILYND